MPRDAQLQAWGGKPVAAASLLLPVSLSPCESRDCCAAVAVPSGSELPSSLMLIQYIIRARHLFFFFPFFFSMGGGVLCMYVPFSFLQHTTTCDHHLQLGLCWAITMRTRYFCRLPGMLFSFFFFQPPCTTYVQPRISSYVPGMSRIPRYVYVCLLYTSPSPRDLSTSRMPSSA